MRRLRELSIALAALLAGGCKAERTATGNEARTAKPAPAGPADVAAGPALATATSLPRADWPSGIVTFDRETLRAERVGFDYASDAPCALPVEAQRRGLVGCPSRLRRTSADGSTATLAVSYDDRRRLLDDGIDRYAWSDAGVTSRATLTYQRIAAPPANLAVVRAVDAVHVARLRVDHGRAIAIYGGSPASAPDVDERARVDLVWGPRRLERVEDRTSRSYLEYADAPVAEYQEDVERRELEAADHDAAALATATAVPRAAWPCAVDTTFGDGTGRELRLVYGDRPACRFPIEVVTEGIVGCPTAIETRERREDGTFAEAEQHEVRYADDRMIESYATHAWRDDGLAAGHGRFARTATGVVDASAAGSIEYDLAGGRLVAARTQVAGVTITFALRWSSGRLVEITAKSGTPGDPTDRTARLRYECGRERAGAPQ